MSSYYTPLRYPGGKSKLYPFLSQCLRDVGRVKIYIEPYAGGAGAALKLLLLEDVEYIHINDADPAVYNFWHHIIYNSTAFIGLLRSTTLSIDEWKKQRAVYQFSEDINSLAYAYATFYLNRTSRAGVIHNSGPIGGMNQDSIYKIHARFNINELCDRVVRISSYADRITVSNEDGLFLLNNLKAYTDFSMERIFVYLDPPYYKKGADLYMNSMIHKDHSNLAEFLGSHPTFNWVLTYDNCREIAELYPDLETFEFDLQYSLQSVRRASELLIYDTGIELPTNALPYSSV